MRRLLLSILIVGLVCPVSARNFLRFSVNMSEPLCIGLFQPDSGDQVVVRGTFNDWQGDSPRLSAANGDSLFSVEYEVAGTAARPWNTNMS